MKSLQSILLRGSRCSIAAKVIDVNIRFLMSSSPHDVKAIWSITTSPCHNCPWTVLGRSRHTNRCSEYWVVLVLVFWSNWVMWRVKEETPNIPHCSVLTGCQSKESFKPHYFSSNMELPLRLKDKKARKQLPNPEFASCSIIQYWQCYFYYPRINFPV